MKKWVIPSFANESGQGTIFFNVDPGFFRERSLNIQTSRLYNVGGQCNTCEILVKHLNYTDKAFLSGRLPFLLDDLSSPPNHNTLMSMAVPLPPGEYAVLLLNLKPALLNTCKTYEELAAQPFFLVCGRDDGEAIPFNAKYYYLGKTSKASIIAFPLHDPEKLNENTISEYKDDIRRGKNLTVLTVGVLDSLSRSTSHVEDDSHHLYLSLYLLDGHHKVRAADELHMPIQFLVFVRKANSVISHEGFNMAIQYMTEQWGAQPRASADAGTHRPRG